ncbi:MAG: aminotransferase class IV, partial [Pseudomonadota bacterium]
MPEDHRSAHDAAEDPRNADLKIWVDGALRHRDEAKVSVYDSGFMLGDGVWEGMRVHNGRFAFLEAHLDRLYEAAIALDLEIGMDRAALTDALYETLRANGMEDHAHVRLMVTRGRKHRPFQDPRLSIHGATVVIIAEHSLVTEARPLKLHTVPQHRGLPLTQDPKLNSHSKLNCILALNHALKAGADEALMLDPFGFVNTTNGCN